MPERISKILIRKALAANLVGFFMEQDNLAARIGTSWFYISSDYGKTQNDYSNGQLVDMLYDALDGEPINDGNEDQSTECLYYKYYLEERLDTD